MCAFRGFPRAKNLVEIVAGAIDEIVPKRARAVEMLAVPFLRLPRLKM
jgi:hypothetical protein